MQEESNQGQLNWQHEPERTFAVMETGELLAEATFADLGDNTVNINHTYVSPILRGQGVAGKMMNEVAERLRREGRKAQATCSYADAWLRKHADTHADILADKTCDGPSCRIDGKH
jgi:uncharacterized protein